MRKLAQYLDPWSVVVLIVTLILFVFALLAKGLTHALLLEAGVFLVSVKLIIMAFNNNAQAKILESRLMKMQASLERIERGLRESPVQNGVRTKT